LQGDAQLLGGLEDRFAGFDLSSSAGGLEENGKFFFAQCENLP
jgi:hypothetical protein